MFHSEISKVIDNTILAPISYMLKQKHNVDVSVDELRFCFDQGNNFPSITTDEFRHSSAQVPAVVKTQTKTPKEKSVLTGRCTRLIKKKNGGGNAVCDKQIMSGSEASAYNFCNSCFKTKTVRTLLGLPDASVATKESSVSYPSLQTGQVPDFNNGPSIGRNWQQTSVEFPQPSHEEIGLTKPYSLQGMLGSSQQNGFSISELSKQKAPEFGNSSLKNVGFPEPPSTKGFPEPPSMKGFPEPPSMKGFPEPPKMKAISELSRTSGDDLKSPRSNSDRERSSKIPISEFGKSEYKSVTGHVIEEEED